MSGHRGQCLRSATIPLDPRINYQISWILGVRLKTRFPDLGTDPAIKRTEQLAFSTATGLSSTSPNRVTALLFLVACKQRPRWQNGYLGGARSRRSLLLLRNTHLFIPGGL